MKLKIEKNKKLIIVECLIIVIFVALIIVSASKFKTGKNGEILNEPQENIMQTNIAISNANDIYIIDIGEENVVEQSENNNEVQKSNSPYYIKVNYGAQVVTIYKKDLKRKLYCPI